MEKPKDRLRRSRYAAGFETPTDAWRAHPRDITQSTLTSHENGNRDISRKAAETYGRLFNVDPGWLLYGDSQGQEDPTPPTERLRNAWLAAVQAPPEIQECIADFIEFQIIRMKKTTHGGTIVHCSDEQAKLLKLFEGMQPGTRDQALRILKALTAEK
jgi:hypothetical protein